MARLVLADDVPEKTYRLVPVDDEPKQPSATQAIRRQAGESLNNWKNAGMGAIKGASDIGAALLTPVDYLLNKAGATEMTNDQRRAELKQFFAENADPQSLAFQGGALGTQVAGTAGIGGAMAKGAMALPKLIPAVAPYVPKVAAALESGGFRLGSPAAKTFAGKAGDVALRAGAGAVTGGAMAGLVNPDEAGTGAVIGGVMPGAFKAAGEAGKIAKRAASGLTRNVLGVSTGAGANAVSAAYQSGKAGNRAFIENMRGNASADDVVASAKDALQNMRAERAAAYRNGMADIRADKSVIDFAPIQQSVNKISAMGAFKGQQINKNAAGTVDEIAQKVDEWANLAPAEFHTPEGLDALKQAIGDIRDSTQFGSPARRAADSVYNAVKAEINKQAPVYAKVMRQYTDASEALREVERSFSLGERASKDASLRKLLSIMRNNVNTNFGNRMNLASTLSNSGAGDLLPAIAGQAMSSATPRGLQGLAATGTGIYGLTNPFVWGALPFQSPRLMGEAAYGLGRLAGGTANAGRQAVNRIGLLNPDLIGNEQALLRTIPILMPTAANP